MLSLPSLTPRDTVAVVPCASYEEAKIEAALAALLSPFADRLALIRPGITVAVKANLVSAMKPEEAATTHPLLLRALCRLLLQRGAKVILGDSPGGLYNAAFVERVYRVSGMTALEADEVILNRDFGQREASYPEGRVLKSFTYTSYLDGADLIINVCKLKSHGMMAMSAAAKNMFGVIPGVIKPEYHYRFPRHEDFADMLLDLDEYFKPVLNIADAVVGMEGNGPTAGTPRQIGCLLASASPHCLDLAAAAILGLQKENVPTLAAAYRRGLIPEGVEGLSLCGDLAPLLLSDFKNMPLQKSVEFSRSKKNVFSRFIGSAIAGILRTRPVLHQKLCVGCGVCRDICPASAIVIEKGKAKIDRKKCIRCFCCQEFCPKSAMKVERTAVARLFHHEKKK
ncbi:MAG: DUF362 domain-containing protein [Clostridia bacterium]|nr:DUF362 domain-containing protein [Clostridia bacterium]